MHWGFGEEHMGGMWIWWIWWILGAALIAAVGFAVIRTVRGAMNTTTESPEQILERRYAKGELDLETYERMLRDLKQ